MEYRSPLAKSISNLIGPRRLIGAPTTFQGIPRKFWHGAKQTRWDRTGSRPVIAGHDRYGASGRVLFDSRDGPYVRAKHGELRTGNR